MGISFNAADTSNSNQLSQLKLLTFAGDCADGVPNERKATILLTLFSTVSSSGVTVGTMAKGLIMPKIGTGLNTGRNLSILKPTITQASCSMLIALMPFTTCAIEKS
ncbi:hypothetical protein R1flu_026136 [Riccia fluitans]|uniref:Uncharacterized protein n=1 Tax=Riccia fluitans TaxID=41844 RepID=A0ABD1XFU5_9MARC